MSGARPGTVIDAVLKAVKQSGNLPTDTAYLDHQPDMAGEDAGVSLPVVSVHPLSNIRLNRFNTDKVGYTTDSDGNRTGRVYHAEYTLDLQLDVWTAAGSSHDAETLGQQVWDALYQHDDAGPDKPLPHPDQSGATLDAVWRFKLRRGETAHDLTASPTLRRWRMDLGAWSRHEFTTDETYAAKVVYPDDSNVTT